MRTFTILFLCVVSFSSALAQNRVQAIEEYKNLKQRAEAVEKAILAPSKEDTEAALRENVNVIRILPREIYGDNYMIQIRGSGAYYSFYYKIPDYGHGSDISLEQNRFSMSSVGLLADLSEIPLNEITKESPSANSLINYQKVKDTNSVYEDFETFRYQGFKAGETIFKSYLPAIVGHTYLLRSLNADYYDVLVTFKVQRKDWDGSLIIFWELLEQFETPHRSVSDRTQLTDAEILQKTKQQMRSEIFSKVQVEVNNGVVSLRGTISKENLAYALQLVNSSGAVKVVNLLTVK